MGLREHHIGAHTILCLCSRNKSGLIGYAYNTTIRKDRKLFVLLMMEEEYRDTLWEGEKQGLEVPQPKMEYKKLSKCYI